MKKLLLAIVTMALVASCSNDDDNKLKLGLSNVALKARDTYQITHTLPNSEVEYQSENDYIAEVDDNGLITAWRIGTTTIKVSSPYNNATVRVTVEPRYELYDDPVLNWGMTRNDFFERYNRPDASDEDNNSITYYVSFEGVSSYVYFFDDDNRLIRSCVVIESSLSSDITSFLSERYKLSELSNNYDRIVYRDALEQEDATMEITAHAYILNFWIVEYTPVNRPAAN